MTYALTPGDDTLPVMPQEVIDFLQTEYYDKEIYFNEVSYYDRDEETKPDFIQVQAGPFEILIQNAVVVNIEDREQIFNLLKKFKRDLPPPPDPNPAPTAAKKK